VKRRRNDLIGLAHDVAAALAVLQFAAGQYGYDPDCPGQLAAFLDFVQDHAGSPPPPPEDWYQFPIDSGADPE
jgi:hypothetical protein